MGSAFRHRAELTLLAGNDPQRYYEWPDSRQVRLHERGEVRQAAWSH